jgi:lipopolysaccharide transport system ATP-binding protein
MYVRLAFAIAASVEPEILIIDEALAVGDAVFQHRCLRRIKELHEGGTTVLFVSHDVAAIRALCSRAILMSHGRIISDGDPADVLNRYQEIVMERERAFEAESEALSELTPAETSFEPLSFTYRHGNRDAEIVLVELIGATSQRTEIVETGAPLAMKVAARFNANIADPVFGFLIRNRHGISAYGTNTHEQKLQLGPVRCGDIVEVTFAFNCWLGIDNYSISCAVHSSEGEAYDWLDGVRFFRVTSLRVTEGIANLNATASARRVTSPNTGKPSELNETVMV